MKTLRYILLSALIFLSKANFGQSSISISDSMSIFSSDTVPQNSSITYTLFIYNNSSVLNYNGNITIQIYNDTTGNGGFGNIFQLNSILLPTQSIAPSNFTVYIDSFLVDTSAFRSGINTVVIWPIADVSSGFVTADTLRQNIFVFDPLSTTELLQTHKITLYPNPFSSKIWFKGLDKNNIEQVRILDVLGKELLSIQVDGKTPLDLSELSKGVYFIKLQTKDSKQIIIKTIKE